VIDINKQIEFWREGATENWEVASDLVNKKQAFEYIAKSKKVFQWLIDQF